MTKISNGSNAPNSSKQRLLLVFKIRLVSAGTMPVPIVSNAKIQPNEPVCLYDAQHSS